MEPLFAFADILVCPQILGFSTVEHKKRNNRGSVEKVELEEYMRDRKDQRKFRERQIKRTGEMF